MAPKVSRKTSKDPFCGGHTTKTVGKSCTTTFWASLGKFSQKVFAPPKICLLLHLWKTVLQTMRQCRVDSLFCAKPIEYFELVHQHFKRGLYSCFKSAKYETSAQHNRVDCKMSRVELAQNIHLKNHIHEIFILERSHPWHGCEQIGDWLRVRQ